MLTKDALFILLKGGNEERRNAAIKRCALKPELYKKLWNEYSERGELPGDATLRSQLVIDMEFNQKSVDNAIRAFRETIEYAGLEFGLGKEESLETLRDESGGEMTMVQPGETLPKATGQIRDYSIPRRGQKLAVLRLEYPVTSDDITQISNWLKLMEVTLSED